VYIGTIDVGPGASYAGWHTHPGPVWVVIVSGQLALYGPDACKTVYDEGSAYLAEPNTTYDLENESDAPLQLQFAGVIPKGQRPTVPAHAPTAPCAS
jgi:quercetin dioxygenase-like cupin family protein